MQKLTCQACGAALPAPRTDQQSVTCDYCGYVYLLPQQQTAAQIVAAVAATQTDQAAAAQAAKYSLICGVLAWLALPPILPAIIGIYLVRRQQPKPLGFWICVIYLVVITLVMLCWGIGASVNILGS